MLEKIKNWLKSLGFEVTEEQLAELELAEKQEDNEEEKDGKQEDTKDTKDTDEDKIEDIKGGDEEQKEEPKDKDLKAKIKELEDKLAEKTVTERIGKIKDLAKDSLDYDLVVALLKDVDEDNLKSEVDKLKESKPYLFKQVDTKGFNPAGSVETLSGVEKAFYERNPDLKIAD